MNLAFIIKNLQLTLSGSIVIIVGLIYGFNPSKILPYVFGFDVLDLELKNIFRAIMGLYSAFGSFWLMSVYKPNYYKIATLTSIIFMGGLAFGRLISFVFDGVSFQFLSGLILEIIFAFWGVYNLKNN